MKPLFYAIITFLAAYLAGCGGGAGALPTLDLEAAIDYPRPFDLSEIAEKIEFIPLDDSSPKSLISNNIIRMNESKSAWFLWDSSSHIIKLFDKSGKFLGTRVQIGRGEDEFTSVYDMTVDREGENIYLLGRGEAANGRQILAYDATGSIFARANGVAAQGIVFSDGRVIASHLRPEDAMAGDKITLLEIFSPNLEREGKVEVPDKGSRTIYGAAGSSTLPSAYLYDSGSRLLTRESRRGDTVYSVTNRVLEPVYSVKLGRYAISDEMFGEDATMSEGDNAHRIEMMWDSDRYVIVLTRARRYSTSKILVLDRLAEKEPGHNYAGFSAVMPEGAGGYRTFLDGVAFTPMYIRDNRLVGYMQAIDIVDNAESITNPDLAAIAATLKEDSNPVIVVAKLKK